MDSENAEAPWHEPGLPRALPHETPSSSRWNSGRCRAQHAALVIALDNGDTTPASSSATAVSQPPTAGVGSAGSTSSRNAETIYLQDAPGVVVITATQMRGDAGRS